MRRKALRWLAAPLLGLALLGGAGCATNPVTGQRQLALISEAQEIEMGQQAAREVEQGIGLVPDTALQAYVRRIGARLAAASERPHLPWSFAVLDDPTPNAFALPGGPIYVTRGLLNLMDSEAELATVLGHEIGHVTARHSVTQISRAQLGQLGLVLGTILAPEVGQYAELLGSGMQLLLLRYSRDAERQSDELGFRYALQQGYDVREMADVFESLARVGEAAGRSPLPTWAATHPAPEERIRNVEQRLAALQAESGSPGRTGAAEYLAQIDGLVYGEDPRQGFFRDAVFYHPELRFRLRFPPGWRTQNTPRAVLAMSPRNDAALQLTLVPGATPAQAATRFLQQEGIQPLQTTQQEINGLPAVVAAFQAQTQQGMLQGWAAFIAHDGRIYQLLGYTPAAAFARYQALFPQVIGSFAPVSDPAILNVQPRRIRIVRVEQPTTLAEFDRRYPSVIPLEELALINQLAGGGSQVAAGTRLKRVVEGG